MTTTTQAPAPSPSTYAYDLVPYESMPFAHSHPNRLATIAALFGLQTKPIDNCRVLELGCASGGNLIPMAVDYPNSEFIGVDLSEKQIQDGQEVLDKLALPNIKLMKMDIRDINENLGKFDYIITHGVFSWIPEDAQEALLRVCKENLSPEGVAYISYNTYPGWHFHGMIRDMMLYHTAQFNEPAQKAVQARALLDFLSQSVPTENNAYGLLLKGSVDLMRQVKDYYLLHDHLEHTNEPIYFHDFNKRANAHGLQYLAESEFSTMLTSNFPKEVSDTIQRISNEIVRTEQYMDFVRNRTFRQTLVCHQDVKLDRNITPERVTKFFVASPAKPNEDCKIETQGPGTFTLPSGATLSTAAPLAKSAFAKLGTIFPESIEFSDLLNQSRSRLAPIVVQDAEADRQQRNMLATDMLTAYTANAVIFNAHKPRLVTEVPERPVASKFARLQAETPKFDRCTNQLHESIFLDTFDRTLLSVLDGSKNKDEIIAEMVKRGADGTLVVQKEGKTINTQAELHEILAPITEQKLNYLAKLGFLVG